MKPLHPFTPRTARLLWALLIIALALTVVAELFIERHPAFDFDGFFGFNAWYGFATCVVMVIGALGMGLVLKRPDNHYDD